MKLKLVGGKTHCLPRVLGWEDVVERGNVIEVSETVGRGLLASTYRDTLNNEHPYWEQVDEKTPATFRQIENAGKPEAPSTSRVQDGAEDFGEEAPEAKPATRRRRAVAG